MRIIVTDENGLLVDAEVNLSTRKVTSLLADDEQLGAAFFGLAVLTGNLEAQMKIEDVCREIMGGKLRREQFTTRDDGS